MPIHVGATIRRPTQDQFGDLDYQVMGCFFRVHAEFGRLFDEKIYKSVVARRIKGAQREVPIVVSYDGFAKEYAIDLLVEGAAVFEAKAVEKLTPEHRAQLLNYLLLTELPHGKLINVRPDLIQHEFINTTLTLEDRRNFAVDDRFWQHVSPSDPQWKLWITNAIRDWGTGLDLHLYEEAVTSFLGGPELVLREVPIFCEGEQLGTQKVHTSGTNCMFKVTTLSSDAASFEDHSRRFLEHTQLEAMQWLNIQLRRLEFRTLLRC